MPLAMTARWHMICLRRANPKLLRARYYLPWRPLPEAVADESPEVRFMLWAARACVLAVPLAFVWFWAQAFITAT